MTFSQPLKLLAIGGSLITTNTLWFFDHSTASSTANVEVNINALDAVEKIKDRKKKPIEDEKFKKGSPIVNTGISFTYQTQTKKILMNTSWKTMEDFQVKGVPATAKQYRKIDKNSIKIKLFKNPAWANDSEGTRDEYADALPQEQIDQLFQGKDEVKVKQLLFTLQQRREWYFHWNSGDTRYYAPTIEYSRNIEELKNLKIKYFRDFDSLREYVHEKVETCKDDNKACVAHEDELEFMDTDTDDFFR